MASITRQVRGEAQKAIAKSFEGLCGRHSRWEVWADWITMSACSISCAVDATHREAREKLYQTARAKYTEAELQVMAEMLGMVVAALDKNPDQDLLGEIFMTLGLGNEHNGQFFTPYNVCQAMSGMTYGDDLKARIEQRGWVAVNDPACGAGALLVAFANECRRPGHEVNYQTSVLFVAQDIDYIVGLMCYIQLSLLGCAGYVVIGDSLAHPSTAYDRRGLIPRDEGNVWYTPMYFRDVWHWRRLWAQVDLMCAPKEGASGPQPAQQAQKKAAPPPEPAKPAFNENKNGQLMLF